MRVSLPTEYKALTPAQTAVLRDYRARWAAIRRSTEPADRSAAEEGVRLAYNAAGLKPPTRLVWCESPLALFQLAGLASRDDGPNVKSAIIHRPRRPVAACVGRRLHKPVRAEVESAVNPADVLVASAAEAVMLRTPDENLSLLTRMRRGYPLSWSLPALLGRHGFRDSAIGQHELSWLAAYDYIRDVLGLGTLAQAVIRQGHDRHLVHVRMAQDNRLDLGGDDRDAAAPDDVLAAANVDELAVLVEIAEVAGPIATPVGQ